MEFIQSTLFSNIIAGVALLCSFWSIRYTYKQNRYDLVISGFTSEKFVGIPLYFCFDILNPSSKGIHINKLELIKDGKVISDLSFKPTTKLKARYPKPDKSPLYRKNLNTKTFLAPYSKETYKYHLPTIPDSIGLYADERFYRLKKSKLFVIKLNEVEQYNEI
ncbi:phage protein [Staphylococcus aureus]|uniref:hypothetical protein n=1 Tax=Staphylococcus aureus TaxID=1280 RepID=UPI00085BD799|nr:hypothetical protein [Staphylococcus aureus]SCT58616.1 phage protein [Staphylococcus aureus]SCT79211.1 phage protein [Staphylococcus aureus]